MIGTGSPVNDTSPDFQPFGFGGGISDQCIELLRFGARDYDPFTGRWTAKDPARFEGGVNYFVYVENNVLNETDIFGLYDDVTHYGFTLQTGLRVGLCRKQAEAIAAADRAFDYGVTGPWNAPELHFQQYEGFENRHVLYETAMFVARNPASDEQLFGSLLHQFQDTYAHEGYSPDIGHIYHLKAPDKWRKNKRDRCMAAALVRLLQEWKKYHSQAQ